MSSFIKRKILTMVGDVMLNKYPPFVIYKPSQHKFRGEEYAMFIKMIENNKLQVGDILLRCFDGYLDTKLIPGDLNHGGLYVGRNIAEVPMIIHATAEGVHKETLYDFMRTDHFVVVRPRGLTVEDGKEAAEKAFRYRGRPYDFDFTYGGDSAIYCTELVGRCYEGAADRFKFDMSYPGFGPFKRKALVADDIFLSDVDIIFMTRSVKTMGVYNKRVKKYKSEA